jgi:hypothetical protein
MKSWRAKLKRPLVLVFSGFATALVGPALAGSIAGESAYWLVGVGVSVSAVGVVWGMLVVASSLFGYSRE